MRGACARAFIFVLASVLLLAPFLIGLTASAPYNPWYDLDENGIINIFDVVAIAGTYQTTGDPGKNVTIARRASYVAYSVAAEVVPASGGTYWSPYIDVDGYSKVTICLSLNTTSNLYRLHTHREEFAYDFLVDAQTNFANDLVETYDVPNRQIRINLVNNAPTPASLFIDVYVIP